MITRSKTCDSRDSELEIINKSDLIIKNAYKWLVVQQIFF